MKIICLTLSLALTSLSLYADGKTPMDPKQKEMMEKFKEYSTPGAAHKVLSDMAGKWSYTSQWWETADSKPQESKGSSTMKMMMGGRFLQHEISGSAMGMPFEGLGLTGYDNLKKVYNTFWVDNMGTGMMHGTGQFDSKTQILTDSGEFTCPVDKDLTAEYRGEWKIIDKNNMSYSMFSKGMAGDKVFKNMEMVFKRK